MVHAACTCVSQIAPLTLTGLQSLRLLKSPFASVAAQRFLRASLLGGTSSASACSKQNERRFPGDAHVPWKLV
ncbi:hypothetical protein BCR37DRAFT_378706 [Protomyces lactucae-debilis]|uniref:Uncharacterized protein n=1 Tax=Protomyces lactucae-debilis TaxID=2754530 RepID=A0A1Y2FIH4_PROLT|nr:uncharacterized protein BCR37DRAFT_378706 [Protomyces lactucae-debilis]ORY83741.1 hypothetical protein BCR37DRAFT_378706 [Protomyces lactucae-debilis]